MKIITHFVWSRDPTWTPLCNNKLIESDELKHHMTNHPSLVSCRDCQDRINELWQKHVEPLYPEKTDAPRP